MKNFIVIALLFITSIASTQVSVQGVVKDSIGTPLELANVIAIKKETKAIRSLFWMFQIPTRFAWPLQD